MYRLCHVAHKGFDVGHGGGAKARRFEAIYRDYFSLQVRNEKLKNMRNK